MICYKYGQEGHLQKDHQNTSTFLTSNPTASKEQQCQHVGSPTNIRLSLTALYLIPQSTLVNIPKELAKVNKLIGKIGQLTDLPCKLTTKATNVFKHNTATSFNCPHYRADHHYITSKGDNSICRKGTNCIKPAVVARLTTSITN